MWFSIILVRPSPAALYYCHYYCYYITVAITITIAITVANTITIAIIITMIIVKGVLPREVAQAVEVPTTLEATELGRGM